MAGRGGGGCSEDVPRIPPKASRGSSMIPPKVPRRHAKPVWLVLVLVWFINKRTGSRIQAARIESAPSNGPTQWALFFLIYKKYKKTIFYIFYKIDKNRLFSYIKNHLDRRKLISIIFYIFWFIQINFLINFFLSSKFI